MVPALALSAAAAAAPAAADGGPYDQPLELVFPADARAGFGDDYHAGRSGGRVHKATDLMGQKLWKLYAAADGEICHQTGVRDAMPSWGYSLTVCGADGREYRYIHLNNDTPGTDDGLGGPEWAYAPGVRQGAPVTAGQWVGYMGDSGNAERTAPHLHFEIHDSTVTDPYGDQRLNPYPSLMAARAAGRMPADPGAPALDGVLRVAGSDRVGTAVELVRRLRTDAAHVVLTPAGAYADTIAAAPLARALGGVLLPTWSDRLDPRVAEELRRLRPAGVTVVGTQEQLRPEVVAAAVAAAGLEPGAARRIAGVDRYATAAAVAEAVWALAPDAGHEAVVAVGHHADERRAWPDALSASSLAAAWSRPVLFATREHLPPVTAAALAGARGVTLVGGPGAISAEVERLLATFVDGSVRRVYGQDRYATSVAVADELVRAGKARLGWVWTATGSEWADAVTAGAEAGRSGNALVLVDGAGGAGDAVAGRWLWRHGGALHSVLVLGGDQAVSGAAAARLAQRIT
ncbi:MAG TPA: cell wall-binding repeat-containing protein [Egibacteraceae bacterium]|nr:cell wall-binding repeat-containing protein [Egibacteraceae bacterium]